LAGFSERLRVGVERIGDPEQASREESESKSPNATHERNRMRELAERFQPDSFQTRHPADSIGQDAHQFSLSSQREAVKPRAPVRRGLRLRRSHLFIKNRARLVR
jgi:hypothetical protein